MNDSLDLRKRILKMRNINNIDHNIIESFNSDKQDENLVQTKKKNTPETNLNELKNENVINNKPEIYPHHDNFNLVSNSKKQTQISYDAQFRLLANKFNEAVEVILELSDKVKNLEKAVYLKDKKIIKHSKIPNLKIIVFIMLILLFVLGINYLPINLSILKLILSDISSLI